MATGRPHLVKGPEAFRTIGEASEDIGVPPHVLRFWESKFKSLRPLTRAGGRRYYRPEDLRLLRTIKRLLHEEGMTIRGAQKILQDRRASAPDAASSSRTGGAPETASGTPSSSLAGGLARPREELRRLAAEARAVADGGAIAPGGPTKR